MERMKKNREIGEKGKIGGKEKEIRRKYRRKRRGDEYEMKK